MDYFGAKFCAVAWDARGYGASDDSPQTLQFRDYADDLARLRMRASMEAPRVGSYKQALHAIVTTDFPAVLPHIHLPTLVIVGDEDVVTPPSDSELLAQQIPGATLVTIPGAGRLTNIERPEAFNAALETFLQRCAGRASVVAAR